MFLISAPDDSWEDLGGIKGETFTASSSSMLKGVPVWHVRSSLRDGVLSSADIDCVVLVFSLPESDSFEIFFLVNLGFLPLRFFSTADSAAKGDLLRDLSFLRGLEVLALIVSFASSSDSSIEECSESEPTRWGVERLSEYETSEATVGSV